MQKLGRELAPLFGTRFAQNERPSSPDAAHRRIPLNKKGLSSKEIGNEKTFVAGQHRRLCAVYRRGGRRTDYPQGPAPARPQGGQYQLHFLRGRRGGDAIVGDPAHAERRHSLGLAPDPGKPRFFQRDQEISQCSPRSGYQLHGSQEGDLRGNYSPKCGADGDGL